MKNDVVNSGILFSLLVLCVACGNGRANQAGFVGSIRGMEPTEGYITGCAEFSTTRENVSLVDQMRQVLAQTEPDRFRTEACPLEDSVGGCRNSQRYGSVEMITTTYFYGMESDGVEETCLRMGGTFVKGN